MSLNFTAIDFETANFERASVCAVGLTKVTDGRISSTESWFVNPPTGLDFTNTYLHGIGPEHVVDAPSWQETLQRISHFVGGTPLVAYSPFDKGVYNAANKLTETSSTEFAFLDALALVRHHCQLASHKLPLVIEHFGLPGFDHHEPGADSLACALITLRVAEERGSDTIEDLWASIPTKQKRVRAALARIKGKQTFLNPRWSLIPGIHSSARWFVSQAISIVTHVRRPSSSWLPSGLKCQLTSPRKRLSSSWAVSIRRLCAPVRR